MALRTLVKVSEVNNLSDARYCAGMGVDLIGYPVSSDQESIISPEDYKAITGWLEGVQNVLEFDQSDISYIIETLKAYEANYLQISNASIFDQLANVNITLPVIFKIKLTNDLSVYRDTFEALTGKVSHFLLESDNEDSLEEKTLNELKHLCSKYPIILGFGVGTDNLEQILNTLPSVGLALKGGEEIRPGYKDFDELADILEELELD